jgi:hypothetical protein
MGGRKRKLIAVNGLLVGLPFLALLGILRLGAGLTPPMRVSGDWIASANFDSWPGAPCEESWTKLRQPFLTITQSGRDLSITLNGPNKITLLGTIDRSGLIGALPSDDAELPAQATGKCQNPRSLRFQASVDRKGERRTLTGELTLNGCPSCKRLEFSAVRQMPSDKSEQ